jgi:hypothetical protein
MADITTSTTIIDNTHECVFAFQYQYVDGGNESAVAKIDVSALAANANAQPARVYALWNAIGFCME